VLGTERCWAKDGQLRSFDVPRSVGAWSRVGVICVVLGMLLIPLAGSGAWAGDPGESLSQTEAEVLRYRAALDYGGFEPSLEAVFPTGNASRWRLSGGVFGEYSDNVDQDARSRDGFTADGSLGVGWTRRSPRTMAAADYRFSSSLYESEAYRGRDTSSHSVAGAGSARLARHFEVNGSGHVARNAERGLTPGPQGVRDTYTNRYDEYGAQAGYAWQLARRVEHTAGYAYDYRDYRTDRAEGQDTRKHEAETALVMGRGGKDSVSLDYSYQKQEEFGSGVSRQNHKGAARWGHTLDALWGNRTAEVGLRYGADRGVVAGEGDYWVHDATLDVSMGLTPRTDGRLHGGHQWIIPDEGELERAFSWGGGLTHRLSERTHGQVSFAQAWEYQAATSQSEVTQLTETQRAQGSLTSRLAAHLTGTLGVSYLHGQTDQRFGVGQAEYWESGADISVSGALGERTFWGAAYTFTRREAVGIDDDYDAHQGRLFVRHQVLRWLFTSLAYRQERRAYEAPSSRDDFVENRLSGTLTATY